jgi:MbtH protein
MTQTPSHRVLVNDEEQHAIVPAHFTAPGGWREAGYAGDAEACERWVDEHWPDIRPRSVREATDRS